MSKMHAIAVRGKSLLLDCGTDTPKGWTKETHMARVFDPEKNQLWSVEPIDRILKWGYWEATDQEVDVSGAREMTSRTARAGAAPAEA